jgi:serine/threonine protein kinase
MPAPTTVAELLDLIQKSGVVEAPRLAAYAEQLRGTNALPAEPNKLAELLIRDGLLTYFQSEQILQGKWKRFTIGKYKVLERLGSGGMGQVYLCEHIRMRSKVAVKILPTAKAKDPSSLGRFQREAKAAGSLDHPNLVRAFDIDTQESGSDLLHYLVMEYVDGASLQEIVKRSGPLDPLRACHYIYHTAQGLQYAYEIAELVHRDVKPGNIMVDRQGGVKLLDMGLARFFNDADDNLTRKYEENVLGTADYLSPEQVNDSHEVDIRADIYSLGATFYFLLTGKPPFPDGTVAQKLIWHQTRQPKPARLLRPDVPEGVAAILERMMMKDPAARYQTPAELAGALARFVQTPIAPPTESEMPRLSLAAGGGPASNPTPSPKATPTPAGRWPTPPARIEIPAATAHAVGSRTTANPPGRTPAAPPKSSPTPRPQPASPPPAAPLRRDPVNPFANMLGGPPPAVPSHNVYATAAARATGASLPAAPFNPPPPSRATSIFWFIASAIGLLAIACGAFAALRLIGGPAGWW